MVRRREAPSPDDASHRRENHEGPDRARSHPSRRRASAAPQVEVYAYGRGALKPLISTTRSPSGNDRPLESPPPALGGGVFHGFERRRAPLRDVFLWAERC